MDLIIPTNLVYFLALQSLFHLLILFIVGMAQICNTLLKIALTAHLCSSINPLHFVVRMSVARLFCVIRTATNHGCVQRILQVGVSDSPFCHNMHAHNVLP